MDCKRKGTSARKLCTSETDFVEKLVEKTVVPAYGKAEHVANFLKSAFSGIAPEITIDTAGKMRISLRKAKVPTQEDMVLSQVLEAPEKLAKAKGKRLIVVFDEFQEIEKLDGDRLERLMRTSFQHHKLTTYVFMGSKQHILEQIFGDRNRPFYKFAKPFPLGKIPIAEFKEFILERFGKTGIAATSFIVDLILNFTGGHPYFTQQLCHETWNLVCEKNSVEATDIKRAISNILEIHNDLFFRIWDSATLSQRKFLLALSLEGTVTQPYSIPFIQKYGLLSPSHVGRVVNQLLKDGTIEKTDKGYNITDIFFCEWIRTKMSPLE